MAESLITLEKVSFTAFDGVIGRTGIVIGMAVGVGGITVGLGRMSVGEI